MPKRYGKVVAFLLCFGFSSAEAKYETEKFEIDNLVQQKKYASAAKYISKSPLLSNEPYFVRQLTHILVNYYVQTINFKLFSLMDIEPGKQIEQYRGKEGSSEIVGGDLEAVLHNMLKNHPNSADVNFAVGEYLGRMETCGCGRPALFTGNLSDDYQYLYKAYKAGLYDYWSLFRIGYHYHAKQPNAYQEILKWYTKSLELNPEHAPTAYNAAVIYYQLKKYQLAEHYAGMAIEGYSDPNLKADAYGLYGTVELFQNNYESAEKNFKKAFEFKKGLPAAFIGLNRLYRLTEQTEKYQKHVMDYIALDYSNSFMFNIYIEFLTNEGVLLVDNNVYEQLCALSLENARQIGALNFNLGKMAELIGDKPAALAHYHKAQNEFKQMSRPPDGAVEALDHLITQLRSTEPSI